MQEISSKPEDTAGAAESDSGSSSSSESSDSDKDGNEDDDEVDDKDVEKLNIRTYIQFVEAPFPWFFSHNIQPNDQRTYSLFDTVKCSIIK